MLRRGGMLTRGLGGARVTAACRRWSGEEAVKKPEEKKEKLSVMATARKYGFFGTVIMTVEYFVMFVVLYFGCVMTPIADVAVSWLGKENVDGYKAAVTEMPVVGPYMESCTPEFFTNVTLAFAINEVTWLLRAPILLLAVPKIATMMGRA